MWQRQRVKLRNSSANTSPLADVLTSEKWMVTAPAPRLSAPVQISIVSLPPCTHASVFFQKSCIVWPSQTLLEGFFVSVWVFVCAAHRLVFACTGWGRGWLCCVVLLKRWNSLMETSCHLTVRFCFWNSGNETVSQKMAQNRYDSYFTQVKRKNEVVWTEKLVLPLKPNLPTWKKITWSFPNQIICLCHRISSLIYSELSWLHFKSNNTRKTWE